ncbi:MAG: UDP-N-acetylglucosamine 2-epimerase (hydrolyzing) [Dorea sp.]|jgi:GDP/UDP-N,N'-diacetylbacillosamine 2-epimerase (hydrolysing)|nr:UDP-N-acetylglucosamine 2-epimerase (hydrolyzing) [Dorea sp.]
MKNNEMKPKVMVVTGTRADYGLLRELLFRLRKSDKMEFQLVVTGTHLLEEYGNTQDEICQDGIEEYTSIELPLSDNSNIGMAKTTGFAVSAFAGCIDKLKPNIMVVLGDRYEIFAAAIAALFIGIPIAHISGGDVTEGAIDDAIRHSITKMSTLHFAGCEQSRKRIIQMGEQPEFVFNVGEPGIENCLKLELMSRESLAKDLECEGILKDYCIVTFHPVTRDYKSAKEQLYELISAMDEFADMFYIITMANADAGGKEINEIWKSEGLKRNNWIVVSSLGVIRYLTAVKFAKVVLGNSSSGIVEAPVMGTPTVNVGDRQAGRMEAESVISCENDKKEIIAAIKKGNSPEFQKLAKHVKSPFGDGTASEKICRVLEKYLEGNNNSHRKRFHDIEFDVRKPL